MTLHSPCHLLHCPSYPQNFNVPSCPPSLWTAIPSAAKKRGEKAHRPTLKPPVAWMTCLSFLVTSRSAYLCFPASGGTQSSPYNWDRPNHSPRYQKATSPSQSPHPPGHRLSGVSPGQAAEVATKSCSAPAADTAGGNTTQGTQGQLAKAHPKAPVSPISALWTHISSHPPPGSFKGSGLR